MQPPRTPADGTAPPRYRLADLEIDLGKAEGIRAGDKIALPKLSFDLLCALIDAAPAIATNDELLQRVWPGLQVSPESVAQRVKLLRSASGDDSQRPRYILGVRGRGYRLIPGVERLAEPRPDSASATLSAVPPTATSAGSKHRMKRTAIAAILIAGGIGMAAAWHLWSSIQHVANGVAMVDRSVAVLPFVDMSATKDQEYFADGMAEQIVDLLVTGIPEEDEVTRIGAIARGNPATKS